MLVFDPIDNVSALTVIQLFWFSGMVAIAVYTKQGISRGMKNEKDQKLKDQGGCAVFPAGTSETAKSCQLYNAATGLSVFMWSDSMFASRISFSGSFHSDVLHWMCFHIMC